MSMTTRRSAEILLAILAAWGPPRAARAEAPPTVDLRRWQSPVRDQGQRDACTYHPPIAALEAAYRRAGLRVDLSAEHLIWLRNVTALADEENVRDPDVNENNLAPLTGGGLRMNFGLLANYGVCQASEMPYPADPHSRDVYDGPFYHGFDVADFRWWEPFRQVSLNRFNLDFRAYPLAARQDARFGIERSVVFDDASCRDPRKIEEILASGREVAVNMDITFPAGSDRTRGAVPRAVWYVDRGARPLPAVTHAMLAVGYDRPRQFLIVKNSFGPNLDGFDPAGLPDGWKDIAQYRGFTLIHYNYLAFNHEAGYITSVVDPRSDHFARQRALGLWRVKFRRKDDGREVSSAVLAWRRLPGRSPGRSGDLRVGDWYGPPEGPGRECRVNARIGEGDPAEITLFVDFDHPHTSYNHTGGVRLRGRLALPKGRAGTIQGGTVEAPAGTATLFGVPPAELSFAAEQALGDNPLRGVDPDPELLVNGSFEQGPRVGAWQPLDAGSTALPGWTVVRGQIDYIGTHWKAADGRRSLDLHGSPGFGGVEQSFATRPGTRYRVTFFLAGPSEKGATRRVGVSAAGQQAEFTFESAGKSAEDMGWEKKTWEFTARSEKTALRIQTLETDDPVAGPALDRVSVVAMPWRK